MVIIETPIFTKKILEIMSDDDYKELQKALILKPDMGVTIKNSGGLRKLRWSLANKGKRGGVRLIYYWMSANEQIYMMYIFAKNEQENLTDSQTKLLRQIVERWENE